MPFNSLIDDTLKKEAIIKDVPVNLKRLFLQLICFVFVFGYFKKTHCFFFNTY